MLLEEQILFFKRCSPFRREAKKTMAELLPLKCMHSPQLGGMQNAVALCTFCKPLFFLAHDSFNELTIRIFYQLKYMCLLILIRTSYIGEDRGLIGHHLCICL